MATEEQIKDLAQAIWEEEGRPEGKHLEHYFRAKEILEKREVTGVIELGPSPQIPRIAPPPNKRRTTARRKKRNKG